MAFMPLYSQNVGFFLKTDDFTINKTVIVNSSPSQEDVAIRTTGLNPGIQNDRFVRSENDGKKQWIDVKNGIPS